MDVPESSVLPVEMLGWWLQPSAHWPALSEQVCADWIEQERAKAKLPLADAQVALAFGFAARLHYGERRGWLQLMDQFALDWSAAGYAPEWKGARAAVKAGWKAAKERGQAEESARVALRAAQHDLLPEEHAVHGGRMVDHGV